MLALCVGAAGAVPGEEWAERLRLLEARFEQSEERAATLQEQSKLREDTLRERVAFLEGEVQRLQPRREEVEATAPKVAAVEPMGKPEVVGRRLSSPTPSLRSASTS